MNHSELPQPRRGLVFAEFEEIIDDVQRLRDAHRITGNWTLAQTCRHLADTFNGSIDGMGVTHHRAMRALFGRRVLLQVFASNTLGDGFTVTEKLNPPPDAVLDDSIAALESAIARYRSHTGPLHIHPFFGRLNRAEWNRLHRIHAAHHLRRIIPDPTR